MKLLLKNIKELIQVETIPQKKVQAIAMKQLPTINNAWLLIENDNIADFGEMDSCPNAQQDVKTIDVTGKMVLPTWCDPHTHIVFARSRENEFVDKIKGLTYEEIARRGGGILNSAKWMQKASEEELVESALKRLNEIMQMGTGAVEIKSGYGLSFSGELKMLRMIKKLKALSPLTIKATFLGAHAFPKEYKENHKGYVDEIINEMLPRINDDKLADYIDVFCEEGFFTVEETERIIEAGLVYGLKPKIHVNQFNSLGGVQAGISHNALSIDHLEVLTEKDLLAFQQSDYTMPTLLPSCSFFLNLPYAPARKLIDGGVAVALATDYNPGSTPSGNMQFVLSLACVKMKMTPEEAINAATINAAYAMGISDTHGSIAKGKKANVLITQEISSYAYIPYSFGSNSVDTVILNGEIQ